MWGEDKGTLYISWEGSCLPQAGNHGDFCGTSAKQQTRRERQKEPMKGFSKMVVLLLWLAAGLLSDGDARELPEGQRTCAEGVYWLMWPWKDLVGAVCSRSLIWFCLLFS